MSLIAEPHVSAQEARPLRGIFVAGSGTDVGKTVCTGALLRCLRQENVAVQAVKPVQTGVRVDDVASSPLSDAFVYAKAMQGIKSMQGLQPSAVLHCFELPASPHLAAAKENRRLSCRSLREDILAHWRAVPARALLLEGAGGLRVPLNDDEDMLDLMSMLGLPVLLAGGNYLGGLNHILLSVEALRHHGLVLAGVALTPTADPAMNCPGVDVAGLLALAR